MEKLGSNKTDGVTTAVQGVKVEDVTGITTAPSVSGEPTMEEIHDELKRHREMLEKKVAEARAQEDKLANFGPGKNGAKEFNLPPFPPQFSSISVTSAGKAQDGVRKLEGKVKLTYDEWREYCFRVDNIQNNEENGMGNGKVITIDLDANGGRFF